MIARWIVIAALALISPAAADLTGPLSSGPGFGITGTVGNGSSGGGAVAFTPLHLYFLTNAAGGGSDNNDGSQPTQGSGIHGPWLTPNHAVQCGDVILAAAVTFPAFNTNIGGASGTANTPSNCPSTSGGIDGTGGVYAAVILCAGSSVGGCTVSGSGTDNMFDFATANSGTDMGNWAVEGFTISSTATGTSTSTAFFIDALNQTTHTTHHVMSINNIITTNGVGFSAGGNAASGSSIKAWDYAAAVGNIVQNSNIHPICLGAVNLNSPSNYDTNAGTHIYVRGNFIWGNTTSNTACNGGSGSDMEGLLFDSLDWHSYSQNIVASDNIIFTSTGAGMQFEFASSSNTAIPMSVHHNTLYDNDVLYPAALTNTAIGDITLQTGGGAFPWALVFQNNISLTARVTSNGGNVYAFNAYGGTNTAVTIGGTGNENIFKASQSSCLTAPPSSNCDTGFNVVTSNGAGFGTNIYVDPSFTNPTDLITNRNGVPNCSGFQLTTQCMGWNAATATLTTPSTISDLAANCGPCGSPGPTAKGYRRPSVNCAADAEYPAMLKGLVTLVASGYTLGAIITEIPGLVTKPCGM